MHNRLAPKNDSKMTKDRVVEVVEQKEYAKEKKPEYIAYFVEISDGAGKCNNISSLRSYADKADALKIRLLDEMDTLDAELAKKKAEEEQKKHDGESKRPIDAVITVQVKKTKNIAIKNVTHTSSWRIESAEDVDKHVEQLKKALLDELSDNDIVNVEF